MEERQARALVRCNLIPSRLFCLFRAQPVARLGEKSPCISKVKILRALGMVERLIEPEHFFEPIAPT